MNKRLSREIRSHPMSARLTSILLFVGGAISLFSVRTIVSDDAPASAFRARRILLLGQKADTHPATTHEYIAGIRLIARLLQDQNQFQTIVVQADSPWADGPELLDGADGVVLFLTEGAKFVSDDQARFAAFQRLAKRGGGLTCLHWGMGTKDSGPVAGFVSLFGGCHGGPDRKLLTEELNLIPATKPHPITSGISPFIARDEFYYALKFPESRAGHTTLVTAQIGGSDHAVAWSWNRPDTGRSFGFTGLHFHENWKRLEYRRLVLQGILWTLNEPIPHDGIPVEVNATDFELPSQVDSSKGGDEVKR